jgi:hypothetical protein
VLSKYDCVVETDETVRDAMVTIASQKRQTPQSNLLVHEVTRT